MIEPSLPAPDDGRSAPDADPRPWPQQDGGAPTATAVDESAAIDGHESPEGAAAWVVGGAGTEPRASSARLVAVLLLIAAGVYFFGVYAFVVIGTLFVSVVLHEFGHFWTARKAGMKATEFFIGFGPRIWSIRRGETEYGLKVLPLGAYVRIIGMNNLEEVDPADESRTYRAKGTFRRMAVVLAGPAMNLLIAFVLLFGVFLIQGYPSESNWVIGAVGKNTAAAQAGIAEGDRIVAVDGTPVRDFDQFVSTYVDRAGQTLQVQVDRDGQEITTPVTLGWRLEPEAAAAIPSQPAIKGTDLMVSVDGTKIDSYDQLREVLSTPGGPAVLRISRLGKPYEVQVDRPVQNLPVDGARGYLGVTPEKSLEPIGVFESLRQTGSMFGQVVGGTATGLVKLFSPSGLQSYAGQFAPDSPPPAAASQPGTLTPVEGSPALAELSPEESTRPVSVVGIVQMGSSTAEAGWYEFIQLAALVNIALAMINLLPLLPFDGGHAVVAAYEGIRGRMRGAPYRVDITRLLPITYGVTLVLAVLGISSIILDLRKPVSVP